MEPSEAINSIEAALRGLVADVLGDNWAEGSGLDIEVLESRRAEEAQRRRGAAVEQKLLAYTHIYELRKIINHNWEKFKPALGDKKQFDVYMARIEDFRNAPMHSRELLPFERELLSGIAGEIRNLATLFRSAQGPDKKHYPIAESIVDSFGTELSTSRHFTHTETALRLNVGDRVQFACRGWDSQNRDLAWTLGRGVVGNKIQTKVGNSVELEWIVTDDDVGETTTLSIEMKSSGRYHRLPNAWDGHYSVAYSVDPPENEPQPPPDNEPERSELSPAEEPQPIARRSRFRR